MEYPRPRSRFDENTRWERGAMAMAMAARARTTVGTDDGEAFAKLGVGEGVKSKY